MKVSVFFRFARATFELLQILNNSVGHDGGTSTDSITSRSNSAMYLYWIHHKNHTDILSEGYVGITRRTITERFEEHLVVGNQHLRNAIQKYGEDVIVECVDQGTDEFCIQREKELRPIRGIGWNIAEGGGNPPNMSGIPRSEETKRKISQTRKEKGIKPTDKAWIAALEARKDLPPNRLGVTPSQEHIRKMLETRKKNGVRHNTSGMLTEESIFKANRTKILNRLKSGKSVKPKTLIKYGIDNELFVSSDNSHQ